MDSFGNDAGSFGKRSVEELKSMCDNTKDAIAFNTLGWVKNKVSDEKDFIILPTTSNSADGLYVKI